MVRWLTAVMDIGADRFGRGVEFWVQRTEDGTLGIHLDLHVDDVETAVARAEALGARRLAGESRRAPLPDRPPVLLRGPSRRA